MSKMAHLADAQEQIARLERENANLHALIKLQADALKQLGMKQTAAEMRRGALLVSEPRLSVIHGGRSE